MIKNIVFDLGGVLVDWNPRYLYCNVIEDEQEMEHFTSSCDLEKYLTVCGVCPPEDDDVEDDESATGCRGGCSCHCR